MEELLKKYLDKSNEKTSIGEHIFNLNMILYVAFIKKDKTNH